jgi:hypothetical protein
MRPNGALTRAPSVFDLAEYAQEIAAQNLCDLRLGVAAAQQALPAKA